MADVPQGVAELMMVESTGNIQQVNRAGRDATTTANNLLQFVAARKHDEIGPAESRAVSGVLATPLASPTTQA